MSGLLSYEELQKQCADLQAQLEQVKNSRLYLIQEVGNDPEVYVLHGESPRGFSGYQNGDWCKGRELDIRDLLTDKSERLNAHIEQLRQEYDDWEQY